jgi:hypothetical protein
VELSAWIMLALWVVLLAAKAFALVEVLRHNANLFPAAGKQTKQLWLIFTALGLVFHLLTDPISLLNIAGTIAAIVFLVDVRPRAAAGQRPRRRLPPGSVRSLVSAGKPQVSRTARLDLGDATLREWDATVLESGPDGIVLDRSAFYPGGGGQPPDHGVLLWGGVQTRIIGARKGDDPALPRR